MAGKTKASFSLYHDMSDVLESLAEGSVIVTLGADESGALEVEVAATRFDHKGNVQGCAVLNGHEVDIRIAILDADKLEGTALLEVATTPSSSSNSPRSTSPTKRRRPRLKQRKSISPRGRIGFTNGQRMEEMESLF